MEHQTSADVAVATLTFAPGGSSGWHHHPGVVVLVVESGAITFYDENCNFEVHHAGEAFLESSDEPGLARNAGTVDAVVHATYIVPTSDSPTQTTPLRIDDPQPKDCNVT
jgi:quercetin dioxygenase-like cupin family protein